MKRPLAALSALLPACALALASCAGNASTPQSSPQRQSVSVVLDWTPNTNHSGVYLAMARGYYEQEGIDVDILPYSEAGSASVLLGGGADFAFEGAYSVISGRARGDEMTMVFNLQQQSSQGIAVRADNTDITRPAESRRQTLRYVGSGRGRREGANDDPQRRRARKRRDGPPRHERLCRRLQRHRRLRRRPHDVGRHRSRTRRHSPEVVYARRLRSRNDPRELGLVTTPSYLRDHADLAKRFIRATSRGYKDAITDPYCRSGRLHKR